MASDKNASSGPQLVGAEAQKHFDQLAATWDEDPQRQRRTADIASGIEAAIPLQGTWRVLEYGCGTAALSFLLAPKVAEVVAADASPGMMEQIRRKLDANAGIRVRPLHLDLAQEQGPVQQFDLVMMAMTLHHIADIPQFLARLANLLRPNGWLAIADLVSEDGSFHAPMTVPHNGFDPDALGQTIVATASALSCRSQVVHVMRKSNRDYPIFLWVAQKGARQARLSL